MPVTSRARRAASAALLASLLACPAAPARAYAPEAAVVLAERIPGALPPAARWNPGWGAAAAAAVLARLAADDADPEPSSARRRFAAGSPVPAGPAADLLAAEIWTVGGAARELGAAAAALRAGFADGDDGAIERALADLAIAAADLSDPFLVSGFDHEEPDGARARFSDALAPGDLTHVETRGAEAPDDLVAAAARLAASSAAWRARAEELAAAGDGPALAALRRERLGEALGLAQGVARWAWRAARSPSVVVGDPGPGTVRVAPQPTAGLATLTFTLPRPGPARLTLHDVSGRQLWSRDLGPRPAGPQGAVFGPGVLDRLPPGVYLVVIHASGARVRGRLVHVD